MIMIRILSIPRFYWKKNKLSSRDVKEYHDQSIKLWVKENLSFRMRISKKKFLEGKKHSGRIDIESLVVWLSFIKIIFELEMENLNVWKMNHLIQQFTSDSRNIDESIKYFRLEKNWIFEVKKVLVSFWFTNLLILVFFYDILEEGLKFQFLN